jgi:hypothetical protein
MVHPGDLPVFDAYQMGWGCASGENPAFILS